MQKNRTEMVANQKYIEKVSSIRYGLNANNIIRPKDKRELYAEMVSDSKTFSKI